jgi:hypothetical protein
LVVVLKDALHVAARLFVWRDAAVTRDRAFAGVVRGDREHEIAAELVREHAQIARAASTFCRGSNGSSTPIARAVRGMSCIKPIAPSTLTTDGLKSLSTRTTARKNASGSW